MKYLAVFALLTFATPAFAEEVKQSSKSPACGKTAEECQRIVDDLNVAIAGLQQQRDANGKAASDAQINILVLQQKTAPASPAPIK